ncbi:uncharacterized protein LOC112525105 [Cynara cardunculus var. scolymus]|uniref:Transmembrane protein n=1 Tax=Cynara cardunculus var. scolymus TaxID=59895 RepID=A0A103Y9V9_CYNCS|nr:uncharacterized protein LOC112525105 [Cynara cardunculus var. scolymus]KVI05197.1 hypothetical protein Ccrd_016487 [Cynara cardunculus var. scolymus]
MHQPNLYRSVDRERRGIGTVKMIPRSSSLQQDKLFRSVDREGVDGGGVTSLPRSNPVQQEKRITRSNLVDQLREYQIRSKHDWASVSFFSSTSNLSSSRVDVVVFVIWELVILAFLVFSAVSLYFRHLRLGFVLATITLLLLLSMKVTKRIKLAQKKKRRMLLPLSM